jgi:hypothetical protein
MKTICLIIILTGTLSSLAIGIVFPVGPAEITIRGVTQNLNYAQTGSSKTNIVGGTTNITQSFKSTTTNFTIDAGSLMSLLENSLNTNFPAGCQLLLAGASSYYYLVVSGTSGTNVGLFPSQVLSPSALSVGVPIFSGAYTETSSNDIQVIAGKDAESYTAALTFTYDDSALTNTTDGTHTKFKWVGLVHDRQIQLITPTNNSYSENVTIDITGSGLLRYPTNVSPDELSSAIFTGSIRAKLTGP